MSKNLSAILRTGSSTPITIASNTQLGGVKQGSNVAIAGDGTISVAAPYSLPVSTSVILGGVKQGSNVAIAGDGTISVAAPYSLYAGTPMLQVIPYKRETITAEVGLITSYESGLANFKYRTTAPGFYRKWIYKKKTTNITYTR